MSVLLIPNPTKDTGLAVTRQAAAVLAGLGVPVLMPQPFANEFGSAGLTGVHFLPEADAYRAADQVVTIGGDGTLLRAGLSCMKHGKPVLGVNLGRTGFLATCEVGELTAKLKRLAAGEFTLASRRLLHAEAPAHGWQADAINDLVVFGQTRLHPMDYKRRHDSGNADGLHRVLVLGGRADPGRRRGRIGSDAGLCAQCTRRAACVCG